MIEQLTRIERQLAIVILLAITICGIAFAGAGQGDPLGAHGFLIMAAGIAGIFWVISGYFTPEPAADRSDSYYDDPSKVGICLAMVWAVAGMFVGVWVALLLAYPDLTFDAAWASFGRLRPVHTSGVIFGFGGNALIATSFHVVQRTSRARLPDQLSPWFVLFGYNLFCVLAATGYLMGVTQSKEYAEPEWYADLWLVVVWVTYLDALPAHARAAQGAAHLRRQLVLPRLHRRRGDAPHRQQPRGAGLASAAPRATRVLVRRPGCDGAMVVRPQRRRLLPHRRLPRHDVLLPAQARRGGRSIPTGCRSSASGASPSSTCGRARTTCTTRPCRNGCRRWA